MKKVSRCFLIMAVTIFLLLLNNLTCLAQAALDRSLDALAARIVEAMDERAGSTSATEKTRIAVLDFPDLGGNVTSLGRFVAEELTTRLFLTKRFEVIERQLLNKVLDELKLSASGFVDSSSAQELGNILGVSAVVSGTLSQLSSTVRVNARVITTTTGMIVAAASVELPKDEGVTQLLETIVTPNGGFIPEPGPVLPVLPGEGDAGLPAPVGGDSFGGSLGLEEEQSYKDRIEQALNSGAYRKAYSLCQEALGKLPNFAFAHAALGYTYLRIQPVNEEQALIALEKAVALAEYPYGDGFAHYLLGRIYTNRGRRTEARMTLEKAVLRYQTVGTGRLIEAWYDQAVRRCLELYREEIEICWDQEDYTQALILSQQAINSFNPAFAYTARGYSLLKSVPVRAEEAVHSLSAALSMAERPYGDGWTYYLLGWAYWETGAKDKAQEALEQAVTSSRQSLMFSPPEWEADCLRLLQECYAEKIDQLLANEAYNEAIDLLEVAINFVPDYAYAQIALGYSYLITGKDPRRALNVLEQASALEEEPAEAGWGDYLLGWAYQKNSRHGSAVDALGKALRKAEESGFAPEWVPSCRLYLTESYEQLFALFRSRGGNTSYYLMLAEESIDLLPEFALGYAVKGYCLIELNQQRNAEAFELLEKAQALKEDPTGDGWIYYAFGRAYDQKGDRQVALDYLDKALRRGTEENLPSQHVYWYRQCNTLYRRLSKQRRMMYGLSVNIDSETEEPYLMIRMGTEKGRPFDSFIGWKWRLGASSEIWRAEAGGELAWEGDIFPPTELLGWYALLGGGVYGVYNLENTTSAYLDFGFYFSFDTGLRLYLGQTNRFCLTVGSEYRFYPQGGNAVAFGVNLGLPSQ